MKTVTPSCSTTAARKAGSLSSTSSPGGTKTEVARVSSALVFVFACGQPPAAASSSQPSRHAAALSTPSTAACSWRFCARRRLDGTGFASSSGWPCRSPRLRVPDPAHLNSSNRLRHRRSAPPTPALYASGRQRRLPAHGLRDIQRRCQRHRQQHVRGGSLRGDDSTGPDSRLGADGPAGLPVFECPIRLISTAQIVSGIDALLRLRLRSMLVGGSGSSPAA